MRIMTSVMIVAMAASAAAQSASTVQNVKNQLSGSKPAPATVTVTKPGAQPAPAAQLPVKKPVAAVTRSITPSPNQKQPAHSAVQPVAVKKPAVAQRPAALPVVNTKSVEKPKSTTAKVKVAKSEKVKKESASTAAPEMTAKKVSASGRRDPFLSPVVERMTAGGGPCASGKKCLVADQIALRGVVKSNGSHIAVVVTGDNRAYFLRENDPIYNGVVTRINENSVTFREQVKDVLGKPSTREVVKKINTPV